MMQTLSEIRTHKSDKLMICSSRQGDEAATLTVLTTFLIMAGLVIAVDLLMLVL